MRRGFSFVELLFAIMILGIGFILIAAIFPVAIRQTAASGEETVAATIAKGAVAVIQQFASNATMPSTAHKIVPIGPTTPTNESAATLLWAAINGNVILPSDNRYAWAAMYERDTATTPYAQVIVIVMQARNRTMYTASTPGGANLYGDVGSVAASNMPSQPNLQPKQVQVQFNAQVAGAPDTVTFIQTANTPEFYNASAVAEGSFLVIDDDGGNHTSLPVGSGYSAPAVTSCGQIYRIGNPVAGVPNKWELIPGNDLTSNASQIVTPTLGTTLNALIVGRSIHDPSQAYSSSNAYEGLAQDISVYVGFVRINS